MDSVGATARTPVHRRSPLPSAWHGIDSPSVARTYDATTASYGSVSRSLHGASALPPLHRPTTTPKAKPTPRHSYHALRNKATATPTSGKGEQLPITVSDGLMPDIGAPVPVARESAGGRNFKIGMYGVLNTVILIPIMISFAQIIFRDPVFRPYMSELIKLVLTSAAIHQVCFTATSSLSFAVGQVQDAGLIFLSAMASSTVQSLQEASNGQVSMTEVLATTLFTLAASTALLGIALIITGKLKIASFVQYLPMPVVGGYLAYIGFYCLEAGLSMMSDKTIKEPADWIQLADMRSIVLVMPGVIAGIVIFIVLSHCDHVAVLPGCMLMILAVFYATLLVFGISLEESRQAGWVSPLPAEQHSIIDIYGFFDFREMNFSFLTAQIPTWIAMYFVVAFSSSLDVAAVEMSLGTALDHNHELQTVGLSNLVSGLVGGFTGSYIFSQTIFTLRANLNSRMTGVLIFVLEIAVVLCPVSIIAYVPKVFFGALQTLIACDLMVEWMWHARHKMLFREYAVVWSTFIIMNIFNLEVGIVIGIIIASFNFIYSYIMVSSVRRVVRRSRVERDLRERAMLQNARLAIVTLELNGFIFFGSSVTMMDEVRKHVLVSVSEATAAAAHAAIHNSQPPLSMRNSTEESALLRRANNNSLGAVSDEDDNDFDELTTLYAGDGGFTALVSNEYSRLSMRAMRTRFFILDFENVRGVDATAVRSCFNATKQLLAQHGIVLVFAHVPADVERLLRVHEVIENEDGSGCGTLVFETVDNALEWCEDELLVSAGIFPLSETVPRGGDGGCRMQLLHELLPKHHNKEDEETILTKEIGELYIEPILKKAGECVYRAGSVVAGVYFVGFGKIDVYLPSKLHEGMGPGFRGRKRILRVCQGGIIGAAEMTLNKRHHFTAEAKSDSFVFFLSKAKYKKMQLDYPKIAARFQQAMLQTMARSVMESNISDD
ncbi:TPA: hypothetical protein N0F65_011863 [Lagenidium giganteum]|uniref:Sulfate transporter n=1 Tax=Lagenidium giganteum TaxID=4803 RepID=A0AAV2YKR1_9STRA|nr:TPA: hypothetical protein N0F65_011863 [Lagenidium giganteum]